VSDRDDAHVGQVFEALKDAGNPAAWPVAMALPDVVTELQLWLDDDRQWQHAGAPSWKSLAEDLLRSVSAHTAVLDHVGDTAQLRAELAECVTTQSNKEVRAEAALRRRLSAIASDLEAVLRTTEALQAAWMDLRHRCGYPPEARDAALRLLSLAGWSSHDAAALRSGLLDDLAGRGTDGQALHLDGPARLERAEQRLARPPASKDVIVWLRLVFARIRDPAVLDLGSKVRVYQDDWLREVIKEPGHPDAPAELASDDWGDLRGFCERERADGGAPLSDAFLRIELDDVLPADAVALARLTASTLGAVGALYGAEPSLWQVHPSHVMFIAGQGWQSSTVAPLVESATFVQRVGVEDDPTARTLLQQRERLSPHLPIREGQLAQTAELLRWLRDARASPPPARLVLCDRAIERISAWAGIATPRRFVEQHLIPSWAYSRIGTALRNVAVSIIYDDPGLRAAPGTVQRVVWDEILAHPDLALTADGNEYRFSVPGMLAHMQWLQSRLPQASRAARHLEPIADHLRSGRTAAKWLERLHKNALISESRRSRTRNAIMHGGPLAERTLSVVLPFAEYMASEAVGSALEAHLEGIDIADFFIRRATKLRRMLELLKEGRPPHEAMVWT
jgi:hypothetical protein